MILRNLTSKVQEVKFRVAEDRDVHTVRIIPHGVTVLERAMLVDEESLEGIIDINGNSKSKRVDTVIQKDLEDNDDIIDEDNDDNETLEGEDQDPIVDKVSADYSDGEDEDEVPPTTDSNEFICDICGAEFASERGLASHKSRAHK